MEKRMLATAVLFSVLLLLPVATADVYVPPGPPGSMDAWINPHLYVFDLQDMSDVGWFYSDGPMYDPLTQQEPPKIEKSEPEVPPGNKLNIPWSTDVMILGFVPGVVVAPDQVPPPVEIVITWNGMPWVVTLELPDTQIVDYEYPPKFYDDIDDTYEFAFPAKTADHYEEASYNIWVGDAAYIADHLFGVDVPSWWYERWYGTYNGLFFWYKFHPNVGDWIAWNCQGETKFPPTYDITALFEYDTSQIWFRHVCFDVSLLEVHKNVDWATDPWPDGNKIIDTITIANIGKAPATELDFTQTFPTDPGCAHGVIPDYGSAMARIDGGRSIGWTPLPDFGSSWPYMFLGEFSYLNPRETMTIFLQLEFFNFDDWEGTIVFDSMISAAEIPSWKYPIALHSIEIGSPTGGPVYLWYGWKLEPDGAHGWHFGLKSEWEVYTPILREELTHDPPGTDFELDPVPVDLNDDGLINGKDVALVRQAIVGLIPYDHRMDLNVNGKIDTQDLAAYKLAAS